jgi:hypothetical protein
MLIVLTGLLAVPVTAHAQDQDTPATSLDVLTAEMRLPEEREGFLWQLGGQAFVGQNDGNVGAGVTAGAGLAYEISGCRLVDVGAQGAFGIGDGASDLSAQAWLGGCVVMDQTVRTRFAVTDRLVLSVEPSLAARRTVVGGRYSANIFTFDAVYLAIPLDKQNSFSIFDIRLDFGLYFGETIDDFSAAVDVAFDMASIRHIRQPEDLHVDILHVDVHVLGDYESASVMQIAPLRLTGIQGWGALIDVWGAFAAVSVYPGAPPGTPPESIDPVHEVWTGTGHLGVRVPRGRGLTLGAELDRDAWPTLDRGVVVDSRAAAWANVARGRFTFSGKAFGGWSETYRQDGTVDDGPTAGGELRLGVNLGHGLVATAVGQGATTFVLDAGAREPVGAWQSMLILSATYGTR